MKKYCVGFAFYKSEVLLIEKARPDFQKGKLNGVGGSLELCETSLEAMVREFKEEASIFIPSFRWSYVGYLNDTALVDVRVDVYYTMLTEEEYFKLKHTELLNKVYSKDEPIRFINTYDEMEMLNKRNKLMYNLKDIIYKLSCLLSNRYPDYAPIPLIWKYKERLKL